MRYSPATDFLAENAAFARASAGAQRNVYRIVVPRQNSARFLDYARENASPPGRGVIIGFAGGECTSGEGDAAFAMNGWEGDTLVQVEHRPFRGYKLEIEERFCVSRDKKRVLYSEIMRGPGGEEDVHEIAFNVA
jgi:hypothetical protein